MRFHVARHLGDLQGQLNNLHEAQKGSSQVFKAAILEAKPGKEFLPAEFSPRDYVSYLLYIDAEIEHALMVQYLYGAYSLGGPQVPPEHQQTVRNWQNIILGIAKEEMGHLISVQNVLRLIGAPLNLGREDYPWDTPFYPFTFKLEPLSLDSLAKYVYAESPAHWHGPLADEVMGRLNIGDNSNLHQVSELFELMIELVKDPYFLPDDVFQANTYPFQATWDEWGRGYQGGNNSSTSLNAASVNVPDILKDMLHHLKDQPDLLVETLASRDDAVSVLQDIAEQGENTTVDKSNPPSHFERFLYIYVKMKELLEEIQRQDQKWLPVRKVATNPYILPTPEDEKAAKENPEDQKDQKDQKDLITNPEAKLWANLFNLRYRMVLAYLAHSFELVGGFNQAGEWTPRGTIINATFGEMYNLRAIANILMQTPLSADSSCHKLAGPPFLVPYTLNLPSGEANRWRLHKDLLLAAEPLISKLLLKSDDQRKYLLALREADHDLLKSVERILAGTVNLALT